MKLIITALHEDRFKHDRYTIHAKIATNGIQFESCGIYKLEEITPIKENHIS